MASERADELYRALIERRYPKELCSEIAYKYLNTDYTATRMLGYLYIPSISENARAARIFAVFMVFPLDNPGKFAIIVNAVVAVE